jgi:hypothetical protein
MEIIKLTRRSQDCIGIHGILALVPQIAGRSTASGEMDEEREAASKRQQAVSSGAVLRLHTHVCVEVGGRD